MIHWRSFRMGIIVLASLVLGGVIHAFFSSTPTPGEKFRGDMLRLNNGYDFINPILACDTGSEEAFPEFKPIKSSLEAFVNQKTNTGDARDISLYIRSLKSGRWFEINGDTTYAPASLLKIFVMIAYYREAEDDPTTLERRLTFQSKNPAENTPGEVIPLLAPGTQYTVDQLINQMIIYSDNDATQVLVDSFTPKTVEYFKSVFSDLNIPSPVTQNPSELDFMSVKNYGLAFRVLFSATYLDRRSSERALKLLTQAHYRNGIVAGVPASFQVAHKFGLRRAPTTLRTTPVMELHDCGIVYYPNHPYLFCVMTRGSDFLTLQGIIQQLSQITYQKLDAFYVGLQTSTSSLVTAPSGSGK